LTGQKIFHPSVEGAQHDAKTLEQFLDFARDAGALGAQPSNFMLENSDGGLWKKPSPCATTRANSAWCWRTRYTPAPRPCARKISCSDERRKHLIAASDTPGARFFYTKDPVA